MARHGVLVCGRDRDEAMKRVQLLEEICRRNIKNFGGSESDAVLKTAELGRAVYAQVDDMAQMIGRKIPAAKSPEEAERLLQKHNAVLVKGEGVRVRADSEDDREALVMLAEKACICHLHTLNESSKTRLGIFDIMLMNYVYRHKYSKQKNGDK